MDQLLAEPTPAQARLLETVWVAYLKYDRCPIFHFADLSFFLAADGLDALDVLRDCPYVKAHGRLGGYGWFWWARSQNDPADDDQIGLTVLGLSRIPGAGHEVALFLAGLKGLVNELRALTPSPFTVQRAEVTEEAVRIGLRRPGGHIRRLGEIFEHEPSTQRFYARPDPDGEWTMTVDLRLRPYADVENVDDYAERLFAELEPPLPNVPPAPASSLALPEAIDYLNAIWHLRFGDDLFGVTRCKSAAELSHPVETREEFGSRVTALYSILGQTRIPGRKKEAKPVALIPTLTRRLSADGLARATAAIDVMQAFLKARAVDQHVDAQDDGIVKMAELGVRWPIDDYPLAWETIQARMVEALNNLRSEVELLPVPRRARTP